MYLYTSDRLRYFLLQSEIPECIKWCIEFRCRRSSRWSSERTSSNWPHSLCPSCASWLSTCWKRSCSLSSASSSCQWASTRCRSHAIYLLYVFALSLKLFSNQFILALFRTHLPQFSYIYPYIIPIYLYIFERTVYSTPHVLREIPLIHFFWSTILYVYCNLLVFRVSLCM